MKFPLPHLHLKAYARLEPTPDFPDIGAFETTTLPRWILFWNVEAETRAGHRNPIFSRTLGIGPDNFAVDTLHTFYLGVVQAFVMYSLWALIDAGAFFDPKGLTDDEVSKTAAARIRTLLMAWYALYRRSHPDANITVLCDLTAGMIGKSSDQALKTKAAETKYLLYFTIDALAEHGACLPPDLQRKLHGGGRALADYIRVMASHKRALPDSAVKDVAGGFGGKVCNVCCEL